MSDNKALPKGLQDKEVERGKIKRPPVSYIPPVDTILDTVESKPGTKNFKVSLPDGTIVYHAVYGNGLNEAFVIHVKEVLSFCKRKNYDKFYKKALKTKEIALYDSMRPRRNPTKPSLILQRRQKGRKRSKKSGACNYCGGRSREDTT